MSVSAGISAALLDLVESYAVGEKLDAVVVELWWVER